MKELWKLYLHNSFWKAENAGGRPFRLYAPGATRTQKIKKDSFSIHFKYYGSLKIPLINIVSLGS